MADSSPEASAGTAERRVHHRVRAVFTQACELIAPLLVEGKGDLSGFALTHILRDHFPELSDHEIHVLVVAASRLNMG